MRVDDEITRGHMTFRCVATFQGIALCRRVYKSSGKLSRTNVIRVPLPDPEPIEIEKYIAAAPQGLRCGNCEHWRGPSTYGSDRGAENLEGVCTNIPAAGGAWHNAGTYEDFFCKDFKCR